MKRTIAVFLSLLLVLGTVPAMAMTDTQADGAEEFAAMQTAAEPVCEVRPIKVPVAGHFPDSLFKYPYKANKYNNTSSNAQVGNGFAQTLTWEPAIEKTFLPSTEYTVTLTLEPNSGWQSCGMPGTTRSFAANDITPDQIAGLPRMQDPGVKSIDWEYQGANLVINVTFNATGAVSEAPELIFYEDFAKGVHEDKTIGEGYFMMAQQANRQGMSNWRDANTLVRKRADGSSELVLGYHKDPDAISSTDVYVKNNFVAASGVRTRGRTAAQGGGAYGIDDIIYENAYGYYEANIKFPQANVVWGAFWLFCPATAAALTIAEGGSKYATEIDIIESIGYMSGNRNPVRNFNAAYHAYRNSADQNATTGPRRIASSRELVYPGDPRWETAIRIPASEEVYIPSSYARSGVDIYDNKFHKIAIEWSPTDYIFYVDGVVVGSWQDLNSHYRSGSYSRDWPNIPQNEGVMQNPAYIKLTVEAASWADETNGGTAWTNDPNNPWKDRRLGVFPDADEMVVDYVYVLNGPKPAGYEPPQQIRLNLSAENTTYTSGDVEYTLSILNASDVLAVELEFVMDGDMLIGKDITGLSGFETLNNVMWVKQDGNLWKGKLTLALPSGATSGLTSETPVDIATFAFSPKAFGNAVLTLTGARVSGLLDGTTKYLKSTIGVGTAMTVVAKSKYDLNRDGVVDALDLGIMLLYCGFKEGDAEWATLVKVNDAWGNGVTASMCDVNYDGVINMLDLIDLFINYTK